MWFIILCFVSLALLYCICNINIIKIPSRVIPGSGKAKEFLSMPYYANFIKDLLNVDIYPGTLNLRTEEEFHPPESKCVGTLEKNENRGGIKIYGPYRLVKCNQTSLQVYPAWYIKPSKTFHPTNVSEWICKHHIRKELDLNDNDMVFIFDY